MTKSICFDLCRRTLVCFALVCLVPSCVNAQDDEKPIRVLCGTPGANYPPFYEWPADAEEPFGYEPDLAREIAKQLGRPLQFVGYPADVDGQKPRIDILKRRHADLIINSYTINEERKKQIAFSRPYFTDGLGVMVAADAEIAKVDDLKDKTIAAWEHTTAYAWVREKLPQAKLISQWPVGFEGTPEDLVLEGFVDAYIIDRSSLVALSRQRPGLKVLIDYLTTEPWGVGLRQDDTELLKQVNQALAKLQRDGELAKLEKFWIDKGESDESDQ